MSTTPIHAEPCWFVTRNGEDLDEEFVPHYETRDLVVAAVARRADDVDPDDYDDGDLPVYAAARGSVPCVRVACDAVGCGVLLDVEGASHFEVADLDNFIEEADWTETDDGRHWCPEHPTSDHCTECGTPVIVAGPLDENGECQMCVLA